MTDAERAAEVLEQWWRHRQDGKAGDTEELITAHPDLADALREHLETLRLVDIAFAQIRIEARGDRRRLGEFEIIREIGRGGMGVVYEALQGSIGRRVALKVLSPSLLHMGEAVERFQREARAAGKVQHTNVVPVHTFGEEGGLWYYAMDLVQGRTLQVIVRQLRARGPRPTLEHLSIITPTHDGEDDGARGKGAAPSGVRAAYYARIAEFFAGVAEGIHAAHGHRIVHRDIKPSNLILDRDSVLKIMDFGLAHPHGDASTLTGTGVILGTPAYMSPEQAEGRRSQVDHRSDIYSLGATLYEVLTLAAPFDGETPQEVCARVIRSDPAPPRRVNPHIPRGLETIVTRAMEKERGRRYATAQALGQDLRRFSTGAPILARPVGLVGRAWRRIERHKVRSALIAAVAILALTAAGLGLYGAVASARRIEAEYAILCLQAETHLGSAYLIHAPRRDDRQAADLFSTAIEIAPDRPDAYFGRSLADGRSSEENLADLRAAEERGLPERTARLARAVLHRFAGRVGKAAEEERRARGLPERSVRDAYFEGALLTWAGRPEEAIERFDRVIRERPEGNLLRYRALLGRARAREIAGDLAGAVEDLSAFRTFVESRPVAIRIASLWWRLGLEERARRMFADALEEVRAVGTEEAWKELTFACAGAMPREWEERATGEALKTHPGSLSILLRRAGAYRRAGRYAEAAEMARRAADLHPGSLQAHLEMGEALIESSRYQEATAAFRRAIELDSRSAEAHSRLAVALAKLGQGDLAAAAAEEVPQEEGLSHDLEKLRAEALRAMRRYPEALGAADRSLALGPTCVSAILTRSRILGDLGRHEESFAAAEAALRMDPEGAGAHEQKADALRRLHRLEEALAACETWIALDPDLVRAYLMKGNVLKHMDRAEEAIEAFRQALKRDPSNHDVYHDRALLHLHHGDLAAALADLDRAIEIVPTEAEAHSHRATVLADMGKLEGARSSILRAIELDPGPAPYHATHGFILGRLGKEEEAAAAYRRAVDAVDPDDYRALHALGKLLNREERFEQALPLVERAAEVHPGDPEILTSLGGIWNNLGLYEEALRALDEAIRISPEHVQAHTWRGVALGLLGRREKALAAFRRAAGISPDAAQAQLQIGRVLIELERSEEAIRHLRGIEDRFPGRYEIPLFIGDALFELRRFQEAIDALDLALAIDERDLEARILRGRSLHWLGKLAECLAEHRRTAEMHPEDPEGLFYVAWILRDMKKHGEALEAIDGAIRLDGTQARLHYRRARILSDLGRREEEIEAYAKVLSLDPAHGDARYNRAYRLQELGRLEEALAGWEEFVQRFPEDVGGVANLGRTLMGVGRYERAAAAFARYIELAPEKSYGYEQRARALLLSDRFDETLTALREAEERFQNKEIFPLHRIDALLLLGRYEEALGEAEKGSGRFPDCLDFPMRRVQALRALGRGEEARAVAAHLMDRRPDRHHHMSFAYLCAVAGKEKEAERHMIQGHAPTGGRYRYERARIYALLGKGERAMQFLGFAAEQGFRLPSRAVADPEFASIEADPRLEEMLGALRAR